MRIAEFYVPEQAMRDFACELGESELENTIDGVTQDDEIIVKVYYEPDETKAVDELENYLERLVRALEEDEDDDEG